MRKQVFERLAIKGKIAQTCKQIHPIMFTASQIDRWNHFTMMAIASRGCYFLGKVNF